jgi:hypothetical protein
MPADRILIRENVAVLRQGAELLRTLDPEIYARVGRFVTRSGIGAHFRHVLEFYTAFLDGVRTGRVDYGARARDSRLERDPALAGERMLAVAETLAGIDPVAVGAAVAVHAEGESAAGVWSDSSIGRELQVLSSHAIHHFALVAILLRLEGVEPPEEFGVAPSTLDYWRSQGCAR